ncbi:dUTP diphosphatase [Filifactor villosus]|uniref:Deoxyuridine 5'-triphosphate nucleotidohydrolase n=1 Tax=Filifactor villosus TaxID=29374 RepID=A0ABV9QPN5_9FIRM
MKKVLFEKIHPDAVIPFYAHEGDAGMDLFSIEELVIKSSESALVHTGLKMRLPKHTEAQVRPRSGLALKHQITVLNSPGTVDEGYRGELCIILINHGKEPFKVEKGMKIAQMIIAPVMQVKVEETSDVGTDTSRGEKGFGSSGV